MAFDGRKLVSLRFFFGPHLKHSTLQGSLRRWIPPTSKDSFGSGGWNHLDGSNILHRRFVVIAIFWLDMNGGCCIVARNH
jgi:hypothetical protein